MSLTIKKELLETILALSTKYGFLSKNILGKDKIKNNIEKNARDSFLVEENEQILAILDTSMMKVTGKNGMLITDKRLILKSMRESIERYHKSDSKITLYKKFTSIDFSIDEKSINLIISDTNEINYINEITNLFLESESELVNKLSVVKSSNIERSEIETEKEKQASIKGHFYCPTCHSEGKIKKQYQEGSFLIYLILLPFGILPAILYWAVIMKKWDGCSNCKGKNLVDLYTWQVNNKKLEESAA